jgi:hypothetical protein
VILRSRPDDDAAAAAAQADRPGRPLISTRSGDLWCLGPEPGGTVPASAQAPELRLPDWRGTEFRLDSLLGRKVALVAWASW